MGRILLSVAHAASTKGASWNSVNEYNTSLRLTGKVDEVLNNIQGESADIVSFDACQMVDKDASYAQILQAKVEAVNRMADGLEDLAVEIHLNSTTARGTCILYQQGSEASRKAAETCLPHLLDLGFGQHYTGLIPFPSPYRNITLKFLAETETRAIIIELCGVKQASWSKQDEAKIVQKLAEGIQAALGTENE